jgi:effector-binding domain-containing protein
MRHVQYAMPVPENTTELPEYEAEPGLTVSLTTWEYGDVAEILHIGPYDKEEPTVKRLMDFINEQGYTVIGAHEEEYLKGPTMFSKGNPEEYVTIIRYRVKKSDES